MENCPIILIFCKFNLDREIKELFRGLLVNCLSESKYKQLDSDNIVK